MLTRQGSFGTEWHNLEFAHEPHYKGDFFIISLIYKYDSICYIDLIICEHDEKFHDSEETNLVAIMNHYAPN